MDKRIYSDSWHQVADLQVGVLHDIKITRQLYRGRKWYVLQDPYGDRFFRITPQAYHFLMKLDSEQPVGAVWLNGLQTNAEDTPTQDEVVALLSHLHACNLLYFKGRANSKDMFERLVDRQQKEFQGKLASFLYLRIPLWNPERFIHKYRFWIARLLTVKMLVVWLVAGLLAAKAVVENFDQISAQTQGVLAPANLPYLYLCLVFLKFIHEAGHVMMTKRFGGTVSTTGIMLLILTPIPYMDASSSWAFPNKYQRMLVGAAGMLVELFVAFVAVLVWANTGAGLIHSLAFNIMLIGSVSSVVFNGNPLLKFDAYYILSDYLEIPNLYERSRTQWYYLVERFALGVKDSARSAAQTLSEAFWLALYGLLSSAYRLLVAVSIILVVADKWFLLGCVAALAWLYAWLVKPSVDCVHYLFHDPCLRLCRPRALAVSAAAAAALAAVVGFMPFFHSIRAQGIVQVTNYSTLYSPVEGVLSEIYVESGQVVGKGQPIARLENHDLSLLLDRYRHQAEEVQALLVQAVGSRIADMKPLRKKRETILQQLANLREKQENAVLRADRSGIFVSHDLKQLKQTWVSELQPLGKIIDPSGFAFVAVVPQDKAADLFMAETLDGEIRLYGCAGRSHSTSDLKVIPYEQVVLPSASLGWKAGGTIPTRDDDPSGTQTKESFFRVKAALDLPDTTPVARLHHGRRGEMRIALPSEPLGRQVYKRLKQLIQKRYSL